MKAWELQDWGLANLKQVERPRPGPNELLVRVQAASLNYRDKAVVEGKYLPDKLPRPLIPVSDAAGRVEEVGPGVTRFQEGDRVTSHLYSHWLDGEPGPSEVDYCFGGPLPGGLAEYMIIHEDSAVAAPASLTDAEAATLPIAALTAWFALVDLGKLEAGQSVLVQGTGGVSIFAVQLASALGARVIATSSSDEKLARARALGAADGINYVKNPEWQAVARELTTGVGVDHVLDVVGGESLNRSIQAARVGGHVAVIGFLGGQTSSIDLLPLLIRQTRIRGVAVGHRKSFETMNRFIEEKGVKPVINSTYAFSDAVEAFNHLSRGAFGKVVIDVSA